MFSFSMAHAALTEYKVELGTENPVVDESYDLTITSIDENGEVVTDNTETILIFSDSDDVIFPESLAEESYTFKTSDKWVVKFENAIKFTKDGEKAIYAITNDSDANTIEGVLEVKVKKEAEKVVQKEITISEPANGMTIGSKEIKVSGSTEKSHKVVVTVNDTEIETTSDSEGKFNVTAKDLVDGDNTIQAKIYDAEDKVIGTSEAIVVTSSSDAPTFDGITLNPDTEVKPGEEIAITLLADAGLEAAEVYFNDDVITLEESEEGAYVGLTLAPEKAGEYVMDILLRDELTHETKESGVAKVVVKEEVVEPVVEPVEPVVEPKEPTKELDTAEPQSTKPENIRLKKYKTKTLLTWDKVAGAESYNIYKKAKDSEKLNLVDTTKENRYIVYITGKDVTHDDFYIKAVLMQDEEKVEGDLSDMTKVQTGPAEILFVLMMAMLVGYMVMRRREAR